MCHMTWDTIYFILVIPCNCLLQRQPLKNPDMESRTLSAPFAMLCTILWILAVGGSTESAIYYESSNNEVGSLQPSTPHSPVAHSSPHLVSSVQSHGASSHQLSPSSHPLSPSSHNPATSTLHSSAHLSSAHLSSARHSSAHHSSAQHSSAHHSSPHLSSAHHSSAHLSSAHHSSAHHSSVHPSSAHHSSVHLSSAHHSSAHHSSAHHSSAHHSSAHLSSAHHSSAHHSSAHHSSAHHSSAHHSSVHHSSAHHSSVHHSSAHHSSVHHSSAYHSSAYHSSSRHSSAHHSTSQPHHSTAIISSSQAASNGTSSKVVPTSTAVSPSTKPSSSVIASTSSIKKSTSIHVATSTKLVPSSHVSPSSSSQAPVTSKAPTMKPTTSPPKKEVVLQLKDPKTKKTCIEVEGDISFHVSYETTAKKMEKLEVKLEKGKVTGACLKNSTANIMVTFGKFYSFGMMFSFADKNKWHTSNMTFTANTEKNPAFHNATQKSISGNLPTNTNLDNYKADNKSYLCDEERKVSLTGDISVDFMKVQIQPFTLANNTFAAAERCMANNGGNKNNSIVPIAVGCALAGLIIIVLIAYLIGRRRSHRGYQQV